MANLASAKLVSRTIDGQDVLLKDPVDYLIESMSLPDKQSLPSNYFEFMQMILGGSMGAGKSHTIDHLLAKLAKLIWKDNIDFFDAQDIGGTIEAIWKSEKFVKFVKIDDAIKRGQESRRSMDIKNVSGTQKYFIIRHLAKHGLLGAGYIILVFAAQDLTGLDKRIRNQAGIFILKSYVEGIKEVFKENPLPQNIIDRLYYLSDNARRRHRNDIRKIGVAVDVRGICHEIVTENTEELESIKIDWITVSEGTSFSEQIDDLAEFALQKIKEFDEDEFSLTPTELSGFMFEKLAEMTKEYTFCELTEAHFPIAIKLAKAAFKTYLKDKAELEAKLLIEALKAKAERKERQRKELLEYCLELLKQYNNIRAHELIGALNQKIREIKAKEPLEIRKKSLTLIVEEAKFEFKKYASTHNIPTPVGWDKNFVLILHDTLKLTFEQIEKLYGIPHSTAQRLYNEAKEAQKIALNAIKECKLKAEV